VVFPHSLKKESKVAAFLKYCPGSCPRIFKQLDHLGISSLEDLAGEDPVDMARILALSLGVVENWVRCAQAAMEPRIMLITSCVIDSPASLPSLIANYLRE
jgi:hypothetical protein